MTVFLIQPYFGVAKNETQSTYFYNCVECWKIFRNEDNNPEINHYHRMKALDLLRKTNETKFNMFTNVPGFMELERLRTEVRDIKEKTFDEKGNFIRHLTGEELDALDKP